MSATAEPAYRVPGLPRLPNRQTAHITYGFSNEAVYHNFLTNRSVASMLWRTVGILDRYNVGLDISPSPEQYKRQVLGWKKQVHATRRDEKTTKHDDSLGELIIKALDLPMGDAKQPRVRVIFCEYDYTKEEIDAYNRWDSASNLSDERDAQARAQAGKPPRSKPRTHSQPALVKAMGKILKGETGVGWQSKLGTTIFINLNLPLALINDPYTLAHEIGHAGGLEHNKKDLERNLMNEGGDSGYWLTQPQLDTFKKAPFLW